jgi:GxxExxY protein
MLSENSISSIVLKKCLDLHKQYGPGLFESIYEECLAYELQEEGLSVQRQKGIPFVHGNIRFDAGFRADLIVNDKVIIEIKSVEAIAPVHYKQVLTYLKLTGLKLGLLINFNSALLKDGFHRVVNKL